MLHTKQIRSTKLALICGLCLVGTGHGYGGHVHGGGESNQLYPYYSPSETTLDHFGVNTQRQSFNRRQLVVALASLFGNPAVLFAGLGAIGNAAYTAQQSASLSDSINDSNKKIDTANGEISTLKTTASTIEAAATALTARVSAVETSSTSSGTDLKNTCDKVNAILAITDPAGLAMNEAKASLGNVAISPGTDPASKALGTRTGTGAAAYELTKCIASAGGASSEADGLTYASGTQCVVLANGNTDTEALTVTDFNLFRLRVVDALNTFENKFRELIAITDLTCPT